MHRHTDNKSDKSIYAYKCGHFSYYSYSFIRFHVYYLERTYKTLNYNEHYVQYIIYIYETIKSFMCVCECIYENNLNTTFEIEFY